jgi:organic hydroperoxide reductase OsmC/OhrA
MTAPFPHHYHVRVEGGTGGAVVSAAPRPEFRAGAPAEFGGRDDWWSPEHLLLSAAGLCLKTTFEAFAGRARVPVMAYTSRVLGTLDKTPQGLGFTSVAIEVEVVVAPEHVNQAGELLQTAKKHCIVANALKAPVELIAAVRPAVPEAAPA